ncbi:VOC family protein [Pedobacter aquatilis]|uniref:VOC family protein n=1 Tax=Pedobacter aquatilis TaxID=351343 RepID=UPI00292EBB5B|nr:VOC family protein [Pedobacter aquatilis]
MKLLSIRIITSNMNGMIDFYEKITGENATRYTPDFAEVKTDTLTIAIGSTETLQLFGGAEIASAASNRSLIIEFLTKNVEDDFEKISAFPGIEIVQPPTLMPWGNLSLLIRDPDGNLVNIFRPVSDEAKAKFNIVE